MTAWDLAEPATDPPRPEPGPARPEPGPPRPEPAPPPAAPGPALAEPAPAQPGFRVSDEERDQVIRVLREGAAHGRLSQETFMARVEAALRAKDEGDLGALLKDLPAPARERGRAARAVARFSALTARLHAAWLAPRIPRLVLPRGRTVFTIGRSSDCDLALSDMTVSWRHAELRRDGDDWLLVDMGSTNGTRANGWRVGSGFTVRAGDCVTFGRVAFRLADHA